MSFDHIPNKEVLGVHDNLEAFTPARKTPQEIIAEEVRSGQKLSDMPKEIARDVVDALRAAGYSIVQVVQTGNKPYP